MSDIPESPGYRFVCWEHQTHHFDKKTNVSFGMNGQFKHCENVVGDVKATIDTFGDPIFGVRKALFVPFFEPPVGFVECAKEDKTVNFPTPVDVAYGAGDKFIIKKQVQGDVKFSNSHFGSDPAHGAFKRGYVCKQ